MLLVLLNWFHWNVASAPLGLGEMEYVLHSFCLVKCWYKGWITAHTQEGEHMGPVAVALAAAWDAAWVVAVQ